MAKTTFDISTVWYSKREGDLGYIHCMIKVTQTKNADIDAHRAGIVACQQIPGVDAIEETITQVAWHVGAMLGVNLPKMLQFEVYAPIAYEYTLRESVIAALRNAAAGDAPESGANHD